MSDKSQYWNVLHLGSALFLSFDKAWCQALLLLIHGITDPRWWRYCYCAIQIRELGLRKGNNSSWHVEDLCIRHSIKKLTFSFLCYLHCYPSCRGHYELNFLVEKIEKLSNLLECIWLNNDKESWPMTEVEIILAYLILFMYLLVDIFGLLPLLSTWNMLFWTLASNFIMDIVSLSIPEYTWVYLRGITGSLANSVFNIL